ncbi:unnamed protein product [Didymodactylos carnosus]|uniref:Tetratricopeptide repeat protein n=1 Tax=Didymodactylos carnosus TaxID=1234261 RepID=A0A815GSJ8_9BILA|nr:unnamed protein product [Didymodactylos carnosus]CAF4204317.1 unnamed protein product [Didymodactylos carnosus]
MYKPDSTYNIWFIELIIQKEKREKSLYENTISNIILGYILYYMNEYDSSLAWFKGIAPSIIKFHVTEGPNSLICSYLYKYCKLFKYLLIKCTNPINLDKKYIETYMEQVYPIHYDSFYILSIIYQSRFDFKSSVEIILYSINIYIQLCLLRDKDMNYIANVYEYLAVLYIDKHRKILNTDIRIMAIKLFLKSLKIHATIHPINKAKMITIYSSIARLYFELKYYGLSIYYCDKAIEYCLKTLSNLSPYLADLYVFRGCTSGMLYKITKERNDCLSSLNDLKKAVQLEIPDVERLARAHFNISVTYGNLREWGLALSHLQNILSFSFQSNENLIIETYRFMGKSHMEIKNYDIAIDNYEKILQLLSPDGHLSIRGEIFLALGLVYKLKSDYEQSLKYFYLAMDIYNTYHVDINDPCFEIIYRHLSEIYKTENKNEIAQDFSDKAFNEKTRLNKLNIFSYPDFKPCAFTVYLTTSVLQDFINDETLTKELTRLFGQT